MPAEYVSWVPSDVDLSKPNAARIYDYVLGGANNFEVDREFAKRLMTTLPDAQSLAQENRAFLRRTVTFLVEQTFADGSTTSWRPTVQVASPGGGIGTATAAALGLGCAALIASLAALALAVRRR